MLKRLNESVLHTLPKSVAVPQYNRETIKNGIVHLGIGAFNRCHQAVFTERVMNRFGGDWGICGVSLRSASVRDSLAPQDCLYSITVQNNHTPSYEVIGAIKNVLVAPEKPQAVIAAIASKATKIVTLTITEKGYCLNQSTGELNLDDADITYDLAHLESPKTAIGYLVAGLLQRKIQSLGGITLLSCDNLASNGKKLKRAVLAFAHKVSEDLVQWITCHCSFPCSMVDRIVPATTEQVRKNIQENLGVEDYSAMVTEPFIQWVIEDDFVAGKPEWESVGVDLVADVEPFEEMKLRLLNASHSTLAYLGALAGYTTIAETMADQSFKALVAQLMTQEMQPSLGDLQHFDLNGYKQQLIQRFENTGLKHLTHQIAMDGSQKIPQRFLPALLFQLNNNHKYQVISLAIAAWVYYTQGVDNQGQHYTVNDPMAEQFTALFAQVNQDQNAYLSKILSLENIFAENFLKNADLVNSIQHWLHQLTTFGAAKTVHKLWGSKSEQNEY